MSPIIDDLGEVVGVAAFSHDIGARLRDDERVRRSETLLAEAQELTSVGSWEWDVTTDEMTWSAELYRILGLDPSKTEPSFDVYFAQIHPDDRARAESQLITMAATGRNMLDNIRMLGGDGIERITQTYSRSTKDAAGNVVRVRGTTQDVSLLARAAGRLERANRHNEALLNSAGDGIYGIDRYGITTFANPAAALLTGYAIEAMVGRSRHDAFHHTRPDGTAYSPYDCPVSASLQDGTVHRCDTDVYWRKDGSSFPVEYSSTPIFEAGTVVGAVVVFKDISERRNLERARDDFVASITHELRTPLTSIRGYLELIADEASADLSDEHRRFLAIVDRNADRLLHVVGDLLLLAQADAGAIELELEDIDVAALIRDGVEVARPQAVAKGLELRAEVSPAPLLRGDRARLGQVVDNLVSNAIKFTPAGGRVVLRSFADGDRNVIEVSDTGLGMSGAEQAQLFGRFYRTAVASELAIAGTGLGLTIVKALVEAHAGTVSVTSATGEGTTFRVELPAIAPPPRAVWWPDGRPSGSSREAVAEAPHRLDELGADLAAQIAHVELHLGGRHVQRIVPRQLDELQVAQHLIGMSHERCQQAELERRQGDGRSVDGHGVAREVHLDRTVGVRCADLDGLARAPQQRVDAGDELLTPERLGDVVVAAGAQPAHALQLGAAGGEDEHRNVAEIADALERLPAVELGHRDVEDDEIGAMGMEGTQPGPAVAGHRDLVSGPHEQNADQLADVRLVVDDENRRRPSALAGGHTPLSAFRGRNVNRGNYASAAASSRRPLMPSFMYTRPRWFSTVLGVTNRSWAMSRFEAPRPASSAIRRSDAVSDSAPENMSLRGRSPSAASPSSARVRRARAPQASASSAARRSGSWASVRRRATRSAAP